jgi:hypothetical protein
VGRKFREKIAESAGQGRGLILDLIQVHL